MSNPKKDMTGFRVGKLEVIEYVETRSNQAYWLCKCDCGNSKIVRGSHLRLGDVKSCGCLRSEENKSRATHNLSRDRLYNIYHSMLKRCYSINNCSYSHYGGRGISVCEEWLNKTNGFNNFYSWSMENGYTVQKSLDRIDVNKSYCPDNCRWASAKEQANNRTNTTRIEYQGKNLTPSEWSAITGIDRQVILNRYKKGVSIEKVFDTSRLKMKGE